MRFAIRDSRLGSTIPARLNESGVRMRRWSLVVLLACFGASVSLPARQSAAPSQAQQPITSGVTGVVVDVVVRDGKGNPVTDLRREDFQLFEDGVQQEVTDASVVMPGRVAEAALPTISSTSATAIGTPARALPKPPGENFLAMVFDRLSPEGRGLSYKGALAYLDTAHENDFVGVFMADMALKT
jgi:hypothetical protein